jgi:hypothetical protein
MTKLELQQYREYRRTQRIAVAENTESGLTQNTSQTLIAPCSLYLCGLIFRYLCVIPMNYSITIAIKSSLDFCQPDSGSSLFILFVQGG